MDDLTELRGILIQLSKALETERACVLRIMRIVERQIGAANMEKDMSDVIRANVGSAATYTTT